ncbi:MAG: hypothetical protein OHK005_02670 [Candidatus Methylacidiphilales bacterium]
MIYVPVRSLGEEGWPLSRLDTALVVHAFSRFQPRVLALELPLHGGDTFFPSYDAQLGGLLDRAALVSLAVSVTGQREEVTWDDWAAPVLPEALLEPVAAFPGWLPPLPVFRQNAYPGVGALLPDADGVVRRVPLFFKIGGEWMPSFALQVVAQFWGIHWPATRRGADGQLVLAGLDGKVLAELPVDRDGMVPVRLGPLPAGQEVDWQNAILASEQMLTDEVPVFNLGLARNKIVLVGRGHPEAGPLYRTTYGTLSSGDLQARMIHALLSGSFLKQVPFVIVVLAFVTAAVVGGLLGLLRKAWISVSLLLLLGATIAGGSFIVLDAGNWLVPWASLALICLAAWWAVRLVTKPVAPESDGSPGEAAQS